METTYPEPTISKIIKLFFKLGVIGFGGPAAHIALMEKEVVKERQWISSSKFLDMVGATNIIPGPNSTEMAFHIGYVLLGTPGLFAAGLSFLLPAVSITLIFAILYVIYSTVPAVAPLLIGIKPVVIAIIASALWRLGNKAVKSSYLAIIGLSVFVALLLGINEIVALFVGGILGMLVLIGFDETSQEDHGYDLTSDLPIKPAIIAIIIWISVGLTFLLLSTFTDSLIWDVGWFFYKVGSILYGSGYVLVAFLEGDVVGRYEWLSYDQLLDAIAIGQFTPGPVLSTSTFIGFVIIGLLGALIATFAIFFPSFLFVMVLNPMIPKMRDSKWLGAFLDAINVAAVGLMAAVTVQLGQEALPSIGTWLICLGSLVLLLKYKISSFWLVILGSITGYILNYASLL